jgi:hypothetical protein
VLGLEQCRGNVANELVKYLVKDAEVVAGQLKLIDPALYARVYQGLEGVRTIATSRKFFVREDRMCACEACGSTRFDRSAVKRAIDTGGDDREPSEGT